MPQIILNNITKKFYVSERPKGRFSALRGAFIRNRREVLALDNIGFSISEGELVGYIGPNGAGKSTTVKVMSGILTPEAGECKILGRIPWKERVAHVGQIGVMFGQRSQLWWDVPVIDSFELIRDIYKVPGAAYKRSLDELTALLDLSELLKTPTRSLSLGQRMRCEIAASLLHEPKTLFLDEPTIGLDAVSKIAVRQFIRKLNAERGTTVILTTHDMQDIEALTQRILLIGKGRILLDGSLAELKKRSSERKTLVVEYTGAEPVIGDGMTLVEAKAGRLVIALDPLVVPVSDAIAGLAAQTEIADISVTGVTAEEMVAALYREYRI